MPDMHVDDEKPFRVAARAAFATYRTARYAGEYQGYSATVSYTHRWFFVDASLRGYRIVRNGLKDRGLGDVALDVRGTLFQTEELALGLEVAATLPTGLASLGLGMGHAMLMPGAWLSLQKHGLFLFLQVAYGTSLGSSTGHGHHETTGPLVNPMNRSEVEHALTLSYSVAEHISAGARLLGAVPVADARGASREIAAFGLGLTYLPIRFDLEVQLPLVGSPFESRTLLTAAGLF